MCTHIHIYCSPLPPGTDRTYDAGEVLREPLGVYVCAQVERLGVDDLISFLLLFLSFPLGVSRFYSRQSHFSSFVVD